MALFVNKQLFWWSASTPLDNNNVVLTDLYAYFSLNTLPHTSVSLTRCISIVFFSFEYFDPYDHYAACWVTLRNGNVPCRESRWGVKLKRPCRMSLSQRKCLCHMSIVINSPVACLLRFKTPCRMWNLTNISVAVSNIRHGRVALSILGVHLSLFVESSCQF